MKRREYKTVETYFIGAHTFRIQEKHVRAAPGLPSRYMRSEFRVHHRWMKGNRALGHYIAEEMDTESGCRIQILRYLQTWHTLGSTKMFTAKGRLR